MLFVSKYSIPVSSREAANRRFKETRGAPPEGARLIGRWHAADGSGGVTVFESDDAMAIARWCQAWNDLLVMEVAPALDDEGVAKVLLG